MKYLILGSKGQLGTAFCETFRSYGTSYQGYDIDELDVSDRNAVEQIIQSYSPDYIINCSAYNQVDKAETDYFTAFKTNSLAVKNIAELAHKYKCFLVHYSTDQVFDGTKKVIPYLEEDEPNPVNMYAKSKYIGELFVEEELDYFLIFRLSWVFGKGTQNFIHKFIGWASENKSLKITEDEISVPTSVDTVVNVTLAALDQQLSGTYHLTNGGKASRYKWAQFIAETLKLDVELEPVPIASFNLPAKRPYSSVMSNKKISGLLKVFIPEWQEAVYDFLKDNYIK